MIKMIKHPRKSVSAFAALSLSAGVAWAACGGTEAIVMQSAAQMAQSLVQKLAEATGEIVYLDNQQTTNMVSAIRVVTKQINVSGEKSAGNIVKVEESHAAVMSELATKELADKVVIDFMSQGFDPCGVSTITKKMYTAEVAASNSVGPRMSTEIDSIGGKYRSPADVLAARESQHQQLFCTQAEVAAGACSSVGRIPGGNTNAALIFSPDKSPDMVAAKNAVINNIIGLPDAPLTKSAVNTPEGQAYILEKKRKDAFMGWAAHSLKSIQIDNETYKEAMDDRVGQYFGTPRATEWAKDQAGQATRGVLVDLVKIQGLQLKVRERRLKENLRMEANIAALLELENRQTNGAATQFAAQQASTAHAGSKVAP